MITGAIYNCEIGKNPIFGYDSYYTTAKCISGYQLKSGHGVELERCSTISGFVGSKIKINKGSLNCRSRTIWKWYSHLFYG